MAIKIVLADDHEIIRLGIRAFLEGTDITIVAETDCGESVVRLVKRHRPHVVLLDVRMPDVDGLTVLGRIKLDLPELPVLLLSGYDNPVYMARAVALRASGYLLKGGPSEELVDAIRTAATGEMIWTKETMRRVSSALATPRAKASVEFSLTMRECEVLEEVTKGLTNKQIAAELGISYETVKEHMQHVLRKIGVTDRTQAAVWAIRSGVVQ